MPIIMRIMALFSTSFYAKCLHVGEDGSGWGHLCHIDTFLVFFSFASWKTVLDLHFVVCSNHLS